MFLSFLIQWYNGKREETSKTPSRTEREREIKRKISDQRIHRQHNKCIQIQFVSSFTTTRVLAVCACACGSMSALLMLLCLHASRARSSQTQAICVPIHWWLLRRRHRLIRLTECPICCVADTMWRRLGMHQTIKVYVWSVPRVSVQWR